MEHFRYYKNEDLILLSGADHARIRAKLSPRVYSAQQQIPTKFYPDR